MVGGAAGEFFGSYHLLEEIGHGGAAVVYRARHVHPAYAEQLFAIKRLLPSPKRDPETIARFRREGYALSMLEHPNIVKTVESGIEGDELFIASEFVHGHDLAAVLARLAGLTLPTYLAVFIVGEILAGLGYGHLLRDSGGKAINVVHRDVKPSNVLVGYDGKVKLTDFGVATITGTPTLDNAETVMGTVGYIAPEVFTGASPGDARADVFAVGAILFELLCGIGPFGEESTSRVVRRNVDAQLPAPRSINPDLPEGLERILLCALARDPEKRFASAREMSKALRPHLPPTVGMPLIVGSFLRGLFLSELSSVFSHAQQHGDPPPVRASSRIAVHVPGYKGVVLAEQLERLDVTVESHHSVASLVDALASPEAPTAILTDVSSQSFLPEEFVRVLGGSARVVPVVAVSDSLEPDQAEAADAIGAIDLLVPPFKPKRLLAALRSALASDPAAAAANALEPVADLDLRVRIVSADYQLAAKLSGSFAAWGYAVDVSPTRDEAIELTLSASPHGVVYDFAADPDRQLGFAERFRSCPGMGLVPFVYLVRPDAAALKLPERCAARPRNGADVTIAATLNALNLTVHLGRTFTRYLALLEAELRYGGRAYSAQSVDLSRGGVLLRCGKMPAVGSDVRLVIRLHGREIDMPGKVVRVQMPPDGARDQRAQVGIAFKPAELPEEEALIAYLAALDHFQ